TAELSIPVYCSFCSSFPNSIWERTSRNSVSRNGVSMTGVPKPEFGNQVAWGRLYNNTRKLHMAKILIPFFAIAFVSTAFADEQKFDAEARARAIAPYVTEQTIALVHIDITRLNVDALVGKLVQLTGRHASDFEPVKHQAWINDFTKAGGKDIYLLF